MQPYLRIQEVRILKSNKVSIISALLPMTKPEVQLDVSRRVVDYVGSTGLVDSPYLDQQVEYLLRVTGLQLSDLEAEVF